MFKEAIRLDPKFAEAYAELVNLYNSYHNTQANPEEKQKYLSLQETYLETVIMLNPNSSDTYVAKHYVHAAKGEFPEQFESAQKALELNRNNESALLLLGQSYHMLGLLDLALKCYNISQKLDPLNPVTLIQKGWALRALGYYEEAANHYEQSISLYPESLDYIYDYARLLIESGKYNRAEEMLKKFADGITVEGITDSLGQLVYHVQMAKLFAAKGEKEKALEILNEKLDSKYAKRVVYGYLGMETEFFDLFLKRYDKESELKSEYIYLLNFPWYDRFRSDPRFQEILAKHKKLYDENMAKYGDI
jgi:tetratricopeptide (TPR) repeat protein